MLPYPHTPSRKEITMNRTRIMKRWYYATAAIAMSAAALAAVLAAHVPGTHFYV